MERFGMILQFSIEGERVGARERERDDDLYVERFDEHCSFDDKCGICAGPSDVNGLRGK
jgi:hypothetical protein